MFGRKKLKLKKIGVRKIRNSDHIYAITQGFNLGKRIVKTLVMFLNSIITKFCCEPTAR